MHLGPCMRGGLCFDNGIAYCDTVEAFSHRKIPEQGIKVVSFVMSFGVVPLCDPSPRRSP